MIWIPITLAAAAFQTARNALQRSLTGALTQLGATYTRFLFGFPFALLYAAAVFVLTGAPLPSPRLAFFAWATLGGVAQIFGTAFLLRLFTLRNFATGIAFSKSEILQVALVGHARAGRQRHDALRCRDRRRHARPAAALARDAGRLAGATSPPISPGARPCSGSATGAAFAIAAVSFRAASLSLGAPLVRGLGGGDAGRLHADPDPADDDLPALARAGADRRGARDRGGARCSRGSRAPPPRPAGSAP